MSKRRARRIMSLAPLVLAVIPGCSQGGTYSQPQSATGVCFSMVSAIGPNRTVLSFHQIIVVKSSGDAAVDITRLQTFSKMRFPFNNPDSVPNRWWSAWVFDESFDTTQGPDCSSLPMIGTKDLR